VSKFAGIQKAGVHMPIAELQFGCTAVKIPQKLILKKWIL
jgi:hypothetical protein